MSGVERLSVRQAQVPINPAGTITWDKFAMHDADLYLAPQPESDQQTIADLLKSNVYGKPIGEGYCGGKVFEAPDAASQHLAIKEFAHPNDPRFLDNSKGSLPTLRANVLLQHGLDRVDQRGAWRIRGTHVLGALVSNTSAETPQPTRWVMERIQAPNALLTTIMTHTVAPLPSESRRRGIYRTAIQQMSSSDKPNIGIDFDDLPSNLLIEKLPIGGLGIAARQGVAAKIDVVHWSGLDF